MAGLREQRNVFDTTNLVVVSDHGIEYNIPDRMVFLGSVRERGPHPELWSSIVNAGIDPKPGYTAEVETHLLAPLIPHLQCWKKENLPKKFHYGQNKRIPAIQCVADDGWMVRHRESYRVKTHASAAR